MYFTHSHTHTHAHILQLSTVQATVLPQSPSEAKKHQLASQLFGGLSGPSRPPKSKQHRKSPTTTTFSSNASFDTTTAASSSASSGNQLRPPRQVAATTTKKPKEPQVDLLLDLEGIDFSSPSPALAPTSGSTSGGGGGVSVGGSGGGGLLANMEIRGTTTQAAAAPPTTRYSILVIHMYIVHVVDSINFDAIMKVLHEHSDLIVQGYDIQIICLCLSLHVTGNKACTCKSTVHV